MLLDANVALGLMHYTRPLLKVHVHKILNLTPRRHISAGEALVFWWADDLSARAYLPPDSLQLLVDHFAKDVVVFGTQLGHAVAGNILPADMLPVLKVGITEDYFAVMDGKDYFLDLNTGETSHTMSAIRAVETRVYNLTVLYARYYARYQERLRSAERKGEARDRDTNQAPPPPVR
jgi:hypothetical protein